MGCIPENAIVVVKGNDTDFNGQNLLTLKIRGLYDLSDLSATFVLCGITKRFDDLTSGEIVLNYNAEETSAIPFGLQYGVLNLISKSHKITTVESLIPFNFISIVHGDAIAIKPFEYTINVEQGGENILNIDVKSYLMKIEVGEVETLPAGSEAYVENVGTANEARFNFGIPKGADGEDGQDATINGVNTLTLTASDGLTLEQEGSVANISGATLSGQISDIDDLIPEQASSSNQLADKEFVNSSIATNTGNFIGTFNSVEERDSYTGDITNNDYCFVVNGVVLDNGNDWSSFSDLDNYDKNLLTNYDYAWIINGNRFDLYRFDIVNQVWELRAEHIEKDDVSLNTAYNRYKATVAEGSITWEYEYTLNNSSFTANQWEAINSGATQDNIAQITTNKNAIGTLSSLTTTDKSSLVGAVNELNSSKQATITGGASTITSSNLTANRALISNASGKVAVSPVTNTELGYLSGATSSIQTQLNGKASTSLNNLSADGQMIIDTQNGTISNCILDIPQDIKLELNNGTLTIKSGTICTRPDGTQTQTTQDMTLSTNAFGKVVILKVVGSNTIHGRYLSQAYSGSTTFTGTGLYYNTTDNDLYWYNDGVKSYAYELPLGIATASGTTITSIDKVFNGAGYIGHHAFVLPNVKALIPDGFNADGSLKSIEYSRNNLTINEMIQPASQTGYRTLTLYRPSGSGVYASLYAGEVEDISQAQQYGQWYIKNKNMVMQYNSNTQQYEQYTGVYFLKYVYNGTSVTQFDVRQPVRLATTDMTDSLQSQIDTKANDSEVSKLASSNTFTGSNTFSGSVSLGSSATATTPATNDNDTSVATTAWGNNFLNGMRSNCIMEIPQDINLTLSNGTLTLKSGSVITYPNGTQVQTTSDKTLTNSSNGTYAVFVNNSGVIICVGINNVVSGTTDPKAGTTYHVWFDTTNSIVYRYTSNASTPAYEMTLPLCIITCSSGAISSIDQVFNGFGYIGSSIFALPGVKGLIPNGRNTDGTLKNTSISVASLLIRTFPASDNYSNAVLGIDSSYYISRLTGSTYRYDEKTNNNISGNSKWSACYVASCTLTSGVISNFNSTTVFHAVDYGDFGNILKSITGYNDSATQTLKHDANGVLTWVTDA